MGRLMSHNAQKLHELLPDQWQKSRKKAQAFNHTPPQGHDPLHVVAEIIVVIICEITWGVKLEASAFLKITHFFC